MSANKESKVNFFLNYSLCFIDWIKFKIGIIKERNIQYVGNGHFVCMASYIDVPMPASFINDINVSLDINCPVLSEPR